MSVCVHLFTAPWCGACKVVHPMIEDVLKLYKDVTLHVHDVSEGSELATRFGVRSLPHIMIMQENITTSQFIGTVSRADFTHALDEAVR